MKAVESPPKKRPLSMQLDLRAFRPLTGEERRAAQSACAQAPRERSLWRSLLRDPMAALSLAVLFVLVATVVFAPAVVPYGPTEIITVNGRRDSGAKNLGPFQYSEAEKAAMAEGTRIFPHIFGTDELCRDYFIRVVYAARVSLLTGLLATLIVLAIGLAYGSISGYAGGRVDLLMMRVVDVIYALPDTLLVILFSVILDQALGDAPKGSLRAALGNNLFSMFVVFGALYWAGMARLVRGEVLAAKANEYVPAARSLGAGPVRILCRHILPNCMPVILAAATMQIPSAIFTESFLSFIGLGVQAPMPSLGSLANAARGALGSYPHKLVFPALTICLIVLAFNLLGDALRDAVDPRRRR